VGRKRRTALDKFWPCTECKKVGDVYGEAWNELPLKEFEKWKGKEESTLRTHVDGRFGYHRRKYCKTERNGSWCPNVIETFELQLDDLNSLTRELNELKTFRDGIAELAMRMNELLNRK
jgi:hypothetical protein